MIELRHLRYFIAVAEELNFRRAAERIHIDQTPLSRTVRDLEQQLGTALFVRAARSLRLTPAGLRLHKEALNLFVRIERIKRVVRETDARYRAPMRVGVADGIAQPRLTQCLAGWRKAEPETPLEVVELRASELKAALLREDVDVGFSFGVVDEEAISQEPAWTYPLVALVSSSHELARHQSLSISDVMVFPLIACDAAYKPGLRRQMDAIWQQYAPDALIAEEARTLTGYVTRVAAGFGVGLADSGNLDALRQSNVLKIPLLEEIHIATFVLHKRQRFELPEALRRFLTFAKTSG